VRDFSKENDFFSTFKVHKKSFSLKGCFFRGRENAARANSRRAATTDEPSRAVFGVSRFTGYYSIYKY
jgi:hypothetical protein